MQLADLALKQGKVSAEAYAQIVERISAAYGNVVAFKLPEMPVNGLKQQTPSAMSSTDWIDKWQDEQVKAINDNDRLREAFKFSFGDGVRAAINGDLGGFLKFKLQSFAEGMFDRAIDSLGDALFGIFKGMGGSGSSGSGGIFSTIFKAGASLFTKNAPGFNTGVSFKVGGSGGADSKYFGMKLTPGEMVNISKPGNDNGARTVNIYAKDYITQDTLQNMVVKAMSITATGTRDATITTLEKKAARSYA